MEKKRRIPVKWVVKGYIDTPYTDLKHAVQYALDPDTPLPKDREYVENSLQVDLGQLYADNRGRFTEKDVAFFQSMLDEIERKKQEEVQE